MDGGICEASVYLSFGYAAGGLCLPLRNYHNVDWERMQLRAECIDLGDYAALIRLLLAAGRTPECAPRDERAKLWEKLFRRHARNLRKGNGERRAAGRRAG
jgi:hypothetical protein